MNNKTCIFTIVSNNYLHYANTLFESIKIFCPEADLVLGLCDKKSPSINYGNVEVIEIRELDIERLSQFIYQYNILELNTAIKPYVIENLMKKGYGKVIYFDPDIKVYSSLEPMLNLLDEHSVLLTPHLTAPLDDDKLPSELLILQAGSYNLGYIGLKTTPDTISLVKWWQKKLHKDCVVDIANGLFVDQKWMDLVPSLFDDVHICKNPGWNVAYWNLAHRDISKDGNGAFYINDELLVFFHYSGYSIQAKTLSKHQNRFQKSSKGTELLELCNIYDEALTRNGIDSYQGSEYAFSIFADGTTVPVGAHQIIRTDTFFDNVDFFSAEECKKIHDFLNAPIHTFNFGSAQITLTKLYHTIWSQREDLKQAFPDILGADAPRFLDWVRHSARSELKLAPIYIEPARIKLDNQNTPKYSDSSNNSFQFIWQYLWHKRELIPLSIRLKLGKRVADWVFNRAYKKHSPQEQPNFDQSKTLSYGMNLIGYINAESGVGEAARASLRGLRESDIAFSVTDYRTGNVSRMEESIDLSSANPNDYYINLIHVNADQMQVVRETLGSELFEGRYNIGYWYWEMPEFPTAFDFAFSLVDEIWVATQYVFDSISKKTDKPVVLVPPNVNVDLSVKGCRADFRLRDDAFVFFHMSDVLSLPERKNPIGVIKSFQKAFGEKPETNVQLILKLSNTEYQPEFLRDVQEALKQDPRIVLVDGYLTREKLCELMSCIDAYISLHRSEGFGLPLAEAMGFGKVAIATNWSGNIDFMNEDNSLPVNYQTTTLAKTIGPYEKGQYWAEPDLNDAASKMIAIAENQALAEKLGKNAQATIQQFYSPEATSKAIHARANKLRETLTNDR